MDIPAILKGEVHLPLSVNTVSSEAIHTCNAFYLTTLQASDFKPSQAYMNPSRQLQLELLDKETGEVLVTFVNKSMAPQVISEEDIDPDSAEDLVLTNPLFDTGSRVEWLSAPVTVHNIEELEFLDFVGVGNTYPIVGTDNTVAYNLAQLLSSYRVMGQWVSGTLGDLCTGGFTLVYKGSSEGLPTEYSVDYSEMVAVIGINYGSQQGLLCLRV